MQGKSIGQCGAQALQGFRPPGAECLDPFPVGVVVGASADGAHALFGLAAQHGEGHLH